jgi:hypothetical protein
MRATAILVGVILAATTAHAGDKMPAFKMNRDYIISVMTNREENAPTTSLHIYAEAFSELGIRPQIALGKPEPRRQQNVECSFVLKG